MNNKLFYKIFILFMIMIVITLGLILTLQNLFLDDYYESNMINSVNLSLSTLIKQLEDNDSTGVDQTPTIEAVAYNNKLLMQMVTKNQLLTDDQGLSKYSTYIEVKGHLNGQYIVVLDGFDIVGDLENQLEIGNSILVTGYKYNDIGVIYPQSIKINKTEFSSATSKLFSDATQETVSDTNSLDIEGVITQFITTNQGNIVSTGGYEYQERLLTYEINQIKYDQAYMDNLIKEGMSHHYKRYDNFTGKWNMFFINSIQSENDDIALLISVRELTSITETSEISQNFLLRVSLIGISFSLVVGLFITKKLTQPIVHINRITEKIAALDFTDRCDVHTRDELQTLATHINTMSDSLENTLEQLKVANEELTLDMIRIEQIEDFRREFIANASHELKTPLTIIKGIAEAYVDGLYKTDDIIQQKELVLQTDYMVDIIQKLLTVSKLDAGELSDRNQIFDLSDLVGPILNRYKPLILKKAIHVTTNISDSPVNCDEDLMTDVLSNLISNAISYTEQSGTIDITLDPDVDQVNFSIVNTPAHIPENELELVWSAFHRADKSRNRELGGTGLGLHIVKRILDNYDIQPIISNHEDGVCVTFSIDKVTFNH